MRKARQAGQGGYGDRWTGTVDLRRLGGRPQAGGDREGGPGLAVGGVACYQRRATRPSQDGMIDGRGSQGDGHALEIERLRLRRDDRRKRPTGRSSAKIEATPRLRAVWQTSTRPS